MMWAAEQSITHDHSTLRFHAQLNSSFIHSNHEIISLQPLFAPILRVKSGLHIVCHLFAMADNVETASGKQEPADRGLSDVGRTGQIAYSVII